MHEHRPDPAGQILHLLTQPNLALPDPRPVHLYAVNENRHRHQGENIDHNAVIDIPIRDARHLLFLFQGLNERGNDFFIVLNNTETSPLEDVGVLVLVHRHHTLGIGDAGQVLTGA